MSIPLITPVQMSLDTSYRLTLMWKELYVTEALNKKLAVVLPSGVYRGWKLVANGTAAITVQADATYSDHVASCWGPTTGTETVGSSGYELTLTKTGGDFSLQVTGVGLVTSAGTYVLAIGTSYVKNASSTATILAFTTTDWAALGVGQGAYVALGTITVSAGLLVTTATADNRTQAWTNVAAGAVPWSQVVKNSSFEAGLLNSYSPASTPFWSKSTSGGYTNSGFRAVTTDYATGGRSMEFTVVGAEPAGTAILSQSLDLAVSAGQAVKLRVSAKTVGVYSGGTIVAQLGWAQANGTPIPSPDTLTLHSVIGTIGYTTVEQIFLVPSSYVTLSYVALQVQNLAGSTAVRFDDLQLFVERTSAKDSLRGEETTGGQDELTRLALRPPGGTSASEGAVLFYDNGTTDGTVTLLKKTDDAKSILPIQPGLSTSTVVLGARMAGSNTDALKPRVSATTASGGSIAYTLLWENPSTSPATRLYSRNLQTISGSGQTLCFTVNAKWNGTTWQKDTAGLSAKKFEIDRNRIQVLDKLASEDTNWSDSASDTFDSSNWSSYDQISDSSVVPILTKLAGTLQLGNQTTDNTVVANYTTPRVQTTVPDAHSGTFYEFTLLWDAKPPASGTNYHARVYLDHYNQGIVITDNAYWTPGAYPTNNGYWSKDTAAYSTKYWFSHNGLVIYSNKATTGTWADDSSGWTYWKTTLDTANGALSIRAVGTYDLTTALTNYPNTPFATLGTTQGNLSFYAGGYPAGVAATLSSADGSLTLNRDGNLNWSNWRFARIDADTFELQNDHTAWGHGFQFYQGSTTDYRLRLGNVSGSYFQIQHNTSTGVATLLNSQNAALNLATNGTTRWTIDGSGNLGAGSDSYKLVWPSFTILSSPGALPTLQFQSPTHVTNPTFMKAGPIGNGTALTINGDTGSGGVGLLLYDNGSQGQAGLALVSYNGSHSGVITATNTQDPTFGSAATVNFAVNNSLTPVWTITAGGVLQASGGNRAIQNVLDPVSNQDAATKIYVDSVTTYINSYLQALRFSNQKLATTTGFSGSSTCRDMAVLGSTAYAVGAGGRVESSIDGDTWVAKTSNTTYDINAIYSDGTTLMAVANSGDTIHSTDGNTWSRYGLPYSTNVNDVTKMSSGRWLCVSGTRLLSSDDSGVTWILRKTLATGTFERIAYSASLNLAVATVIGASPTQLATSTDGTAWTLLSSVLSGDSVTTGYRAINYGTLPNGTSVFLLNTNSPTYGSEIYSSTNGNTWTKRWADNNYPATNVITKFNFGTYWCVASSGLYLLATVDLITYDQWPVPPVTPVFTTRGCAIFGTGNRYITFGGSGISRNSIFIP